MAVYFLTKKAVEDLSAIWDYTYEAYSENQADKYYGLLIAAFQEIAENPEIGKRYNEIGEAVLGLRVGKHVIFYRIIKTAAVEVLRILHQRMDLKSRMEE